MSNIETLGTSPVTTLILGAAFKGFCLVLAAWCVVWMLRRSAASRRHVVWTVAAFGLLLIPTMTLLLPTMKVLVPQWWPTGEVVQAVVPPEHQPLFVSSDDAMQTDKATVTIIESAPSASLRTAESTGEMPPIESAHANAPASAWFSVLTIWCLGAFVALLVPVAGLWQVIRLGRRAESVSDPNVLRVFEQAKTKLKVARDVRLLSSNVCSTPLTWGAVRPVILLPIDASSWAEGRLRMVLLHELGHIKRFDWLTQMVTQLACAVHWFNPLAWFVGRRMQVERELACDDLVLQTGATASDYAGELLHFATQLRGASLLGGGAVPMLSLIHI